MGNKVGTGLGPPTPLPAGCDPEEQNRLFLPCLSLPTAHLPPAILRLAGPHPPDPITRGQ